MQYRDFGATDIKVSILGLGCARIGSFHSKSNDNEAIAMFHKALDSGINFFDTSDIYGQGDSERVLGRAFRGQRDMVIFETKAGNCFSEAARVASRFKAPIRMVLKRLPFLMKKVQQVRATQLSQNFDPVYLATAVDASLRRLNTDYIDVFMLHSPPTEIIRMGEYLELMDRLKSSGKIRYFGISCDTGEDALLCLNNSRVDAIQVPVNNNERLVLESVLPLANTLGVGVVARSPFSTGSLFRNNSDSADHMSISPTKILTTAQSALLSAASHKGVSVVIAGMSNSKHLHENILPFSS